MFIPSPAYPSLFSLSPLDACPAVAAAPVGPADPADVTDVDATDVAAPESCCWCVAAVAFAAPLACSRLVCLITPACASELPLWPRPIWWSDEEMCPDGVGDSMMSRLDNTLKQLFKKDERDVNTL